MRAPRRARPDLEWPWCDACEMHVREVGGVKHECASPAAASSPQTEFVWPRPEQPSLFGGTP